MSSSNHNKYYSYDSAKERVNDPHALVSVIVPIYNAGPYLDQALNSLEVQTHDNLEIICLNDGSTDDSLQIMQRHAENDERIVIIDKQNQGYGATCNRGLEEAHGEWIAILEPDTGLNPACSRTCWSSRQVSPRKSTSSRRRIGASRTPARPQSKSSNAATSDELHVDKQPFVITDAIHLLHHHPSIWSAIYRKSFLDEFDIRFKPIPGAGWADNPFLVETLCRARSIVYLDQPYYCYREDTEEKSANFHRNNPDIPFDRWNEMLDIIEDLGITDERILCAHYSRGFMYMSGVLEQHDADEPAVRAQIERMFKRMDADLVFKYPHISPGCRRLFAEVRGLPEPKVNHLQYGANLVEQGVYNLRNIGFKGTLDAVSNYFAKYKKRTGGR